MIARFPENVMLSTTNFVSTATTYYSDNKAQDQSDSKVYILLEVDFTFWSTQDACKNNLSKITGKLLPEIK